MSGSTQYTVKSNASYDGSGVPHPDVSIGSAIDVGVTANVGATPTMATLAATMQGTPRFYSRQLLKDSDITNINPGVEFGGLISFYRDFPQSRFWSMWSVRSETVSGTQRLRFMNKQDARLCTLEQALLSVGYPMSGLPTDAYEPSDISTLNTALFANRVFMAVWRA